MRVAVTRDEIASMARLTKLMFESDLKPPEVLVFSRNETGEICVTSPVRKDGVILRAYRYMTRAQIKEVLEDSGVLRKGGD